VAVVAALVTLLVLRGVARRDDPVEPPTRPSRSEPQPALAGPGPAGLRAEVPVGFARTEAGAVAAAASYVTTGSTLLAMDLLAVEAAVRQMAAEDTADRQVEDALARIAATRSALAAGEGPIHFRQGCLAARVDAWTPQRAQVAVWNVGVLSRKAAAPPQAAWAVSSFDLVWEHGDWKIHAETINPGPAPIVNGSVTPATSEEFAAALAGFVDLDDRR
jgi:hypothetical protein